MLTRVTMIVLVGAAAAALAVSAAAVPESSRSSAAAASQGQQTNATPLRADGPAVRPDPTIGRVPTFSVDFDTPAAADGPFAATYAQSWQPYPDGTGGRYWSGSQISAHDGYMDVALDGEHGAAGTFGTPEDAWSHVGGTFSIRARATGGADNGVAVMLWPTSDDWGDGEVNFPEGNFDSTPRVFHHSMVPGHEKRFDHYNTRVSWSSWHTYTMEWIPGRAVNYYLDGELVYTVARNVPSSPHRYMFQVGNWGDPGHLEIDWVRTYDPR
ncbi:glycoside hydrolase family 16 protein [Curtobacterium sp. 18060]|uniref:glycoside hydrolase family 16 protein n=1 Tax=Curtobacterium sp. 18060 TaxID=2681408 RepID=UPI0013576CD5|nr:glycoside hydrolase family 16 protein [Curtobacterium sp. 18060]